MIKRLLLLLVMVLFMTASLYADASPSERPNKAGAKTSTVSKYRGKFQLLEDHFDFGYMPPNSKASHQFWMKNIGKDSLEIVKVSPG